MLNQRFSNWGPWTPTGPQESAKGSMEKFREKLCKNKYIYALNKEMVKINTKNKLKMIKINKQINKRSNSTVQ